MRIGAVVALAIAVAFVVWLVVRGGDSSPARTRASTVAAISATGVTPERLREVSVEAGHPIYWLGPRPNNTYELTRTTDDRIYVRYLPEGVDVGTKDATYTIVGTYPVKNAYAVLQSLSKKKNEASFTGPRGALAVYSTERPTNVYLAYAGADSQIEVFDPSPTRARALITSGQVRPVR